MIPSNRSFGGEKRISRRQERISFKTEVSLEFERFSGFIAEYSENISTGGMFIKTESPKSKGTVFSFEFRLKPDVCLIQGWGEVVWARGPEQATATQPPGMGIKFIDLDEESRTVIRKITKHRDKESQDLSSLEEIIQSEDARAVANAPRAAVLAVEEELEVKRPGRRAATIGGLSLLILLVAFYFYGETLVKTIRELPAKFESAAPIKPVSQVNARQATKLVDVIQENTGERSSRFSLVFDGSVNNSDVNFFKIESRPVKYVLDVADIGQSFSKSKVEFSDTRLLQVRFGLHNNPKKIRVVFDMRPDFDGRADLTFDHDSVRLKLYD